MSKKPLESSVTSLSMFIILIAFLVLSSCSSNRPAAVDERSRPYSYKGKTHRVIKGETLFSISWRYGLDLKKLAEFNGIKPPYTIYPDQRIRLDTRSTNRGAGAGALASNNNKNTTYGSYNRSGNGTPKSNNPSTSSNQQSPVKWQWPVSGKLIARFQGDSGLNKGIDLSGKLGEPVLAAASGKVVYAGSGLSGYGKLLIIKHNETFLSAYAHNDEISVKEGDLVKAGQRIADMGSSGTDRVKLHFEIRSEGSPVDPLKYLPKQP